MIKMSEENTSGIEEGKATGETAPAADDTADAPAWLDELTPRQIVKELDKYIVGQSAAKKSVAIALRNRWRRQRVPEEIRDEIMPANIVMIGPTGVGKTEIARRLSRLAGAPFVKVEASKFTEVGYVGRDVESMIRDLVDMAIGMVRDEREDEVQHVAEERVQGRLLDLLIPPVQTEAPKRQGMQNPLRAFVVSTQGQVEDRRTEEEKRAEAAKTPETPAEREEARKRRERTREKFRQLLEDGKLEEREVEVEVQQSMPLDNMMVPMGGMEGMDFNFTEMLQDMLPKKTKRRQVTVAEARRILMQDELDKLVNMDDVVAEALDRAEETGIVFLDEIDKVVGERGKSAGGPDVSREGVQRDLLPIVEGSTVQTKYGMVRTDHMLFVAAGAFHVAKPSDMIPELQGRFPIRVELRSLTEADFIRILREPKNALLTQYQELVAAEGADLQFTDSAVEAIASVATGLNDRMENIGARRLHTVLTTLLEDLLFDLPEIKDERDTITVDAPEVRQRLKEVMEDEDLRRYIL